MRSKVRACYCVRVGEGQLPAGDAKVVWHRLCEVMEYDAWHGTGEFNSQVEKFNSDRICAAHVSMVNRETCWTCCRCVQSQPGNGKKMRCPARPVFSLSVRRVLRRSSLGRCETVGCMFLSFGGLVRGTRYEILKRQSYFIVLARRCR